LSYKNTKCFYFNEIIRGKNYKIDDCGFALSKV